MSFEFKNPKWLKEAVHRRRLTLDERHIMNRIISKVLDYPLEDIGVKWLSTEDFFVYEASVGESWTLQPVIHWLEFLMSDRVLDVIFKGNRDSQYIMFESSNLFKYLEQYL